MTFVKLQSVLLEHLLVLHIYLHTHRPSRTVTLMLSPLPLSLSSTVSPNSLFLSFSLESEHTYKIAYFRSFKKEETSTNNLHYSLNRQTHCYGQSFPSSTSISFNKLHSSKQLEKHILKTN